MPKGTPFDTAGFGSGDVLHSSTLGVGSALPGYRSIDGKGVAKQVADIAARNAIPDAAASRDATTQTRQEGMYCYVADDGTGNPANFQLQGGITNADWVRVPLQGIPPRSRDSDDTGTIEIGHILCQSPTTARRVQRANPATDNALSRPVALAATQQATQGDPVQVQTADGEEERCLLRPGLSPALGDEVILSTTIGEGTLPGSGVGEPTSGQVLQRVGIITDLLTHNGTTDTTVLVQVDFGHRRIVS